tara:strand:+ start:280 stop:657 length:378 start_codon:yes stop_codon:yes gene_type:complete
MISLERDAKVAKKEKYVEPKWRDVSLQVPNGSPYHGRECKIGNDTYMYALMWNESYYMLQIDYADGTSDVQRCQSRSIANSRILARIEEYKQEHGKSDTKCNHCNDGKPREEEQGVYFSQTHSVY